MSWVKMISEEEAEGELAQLYSQLIEPWGGVDNIFKIHGQHPALIAAHLQLYRTVMYGKSPLKRPQREMIGVVVSAINQCHY